MGGLIQMMPVELNERPYTTLSGGTKLSMALGEAPGIVDPSAEIAFVFCTLKMGSAGAAKGATTMMDDMKKADKRAEKGGAVKNAKANEAALSELIRTTAFASNGYVTKTSNGVSLLSFHSASEGCRFIKAMIDAAAGNSDYVFYGGLHVGKPSSAFPNKGSGRCDYLGPPVNTSARILSLAAEKRVQEGRWHLRWCRRRASIPEVGVCRAGYAGGGWQVLHEGCLRAYAVLCLQGLSSGQSEFADSRHTCFTATPNLYYGLSLWVTRRSSRSNGVVECYFKIHNLAQTSPLCLVVATVVVAIPVPANKTR